MINQKEKLVKAFVDAILASNEEAEAKAWEAVQIAEDMDIKDIEECKREAVSFLNRDVKQDVLH